MSRLVTASIVGAVKWYKTCPPSWKEKALTDLRNQLGRVWSDEPKPSLELGKSFESAVYSCCEKSKEAGSDHFRWFIGECQGGEFQRVAKKYVTLNGFEYCLYGKLDVWFPDVVKDIKTTKNYKGPEHYLSSFQHVLYCYLTGIRKFRYLVAEFEDKLEKPKMLAHHAIDYEVGSEVDLEVVVLARVTELVEFLEQNTELMELYKHKFSRY